MVFGYCCKEAADFLKMPFTELHAQSGYEGQTVKHNQMQLCSLPVDVLGLVRWAVRGLRLNMSALTSWSEKSLDSTRLGSPPLTRSGGDDLAAITEDTSII